MQIVTKNLDQHSSISINSSKNEQYNFKAGQFAWLNGNMIQHLIPDSEDGGTALTQSDWLLLERATPSPYEMSTWTRLVPRITKTSAPAKTWNIIHFNQQVSHNSNCTSFAILFNKLCGYKEKCSTTQHSNCNNIHPTLLTNGVPCKLVTVWETKEDTDSEVPDQF